MRKAGVLDPSTLPHLILTATHFTDGQMEVPESHTDKTQIQLLLAPKLWIPELPFSSLLFATKP